MVFSENVVRDLFRNAKIPCIILHSDSLTIESVNRSFNELADITHDLQQTAITNLFSSGSFNHELQSQLQQAIDASKSVVINEVHLQFRKSSEPKIFDINI